VVSCSGLRWEKRGGTDTTAAPPPPSIVIERERVQEQQKWRRSCKKCSTISILSGDLHLIHLFTTLLIRQVSIRFFFWVVLIIAVYFVYYFNGNCSIGCSSSCKLFRNASLIVQETLLLKWFVNFGSLILKCVCPTSIIEIWKWGLSMIKIRGVDMYIKLVSYSTYSELVLNGTSFELICMTLRLMPN